MNAIGAAGLGLTIQIVAKQSRDAGPPDHSYIVDATSAGGRTKR